MPSKLRACGRNSTPVDVFSHCPAPTPFCLGVVGITHLLSGPLAGRQTVVSCTVCWLLVSILDSGPAIADLRHKFAQSFHGPHRAVCDKRNCSCRFSTTTHFNHASTAGYLQGSRLQGVVGAIDTYKRHGVYKYRVSSRMVGNLEADRLSPARLACVEGVASVRF
jgi:hypothetical protein